MKPERRLPCENVSLVLQLENGKHELDLSLAYGEDGVLRELCFVGRGKIGHGLDLLLHDLGIKVSRAIQGRDPQTGEVIR